MSDRCQYRYEDGYSPCGLSRANHSAREVNHPFTPAPAEGGSEAPVEPRRMNLPVTAGAGRVLPHLENADCKSVGCVPVVAATSETVQAEPESTEGTLREREQRTRDIKLAARLAHIAIRIDCKEVEWRDADTLRDAAIRLRDLSAPKRPSPADLERFEKLLDEAMCAEGDYVAAMQFPHKLADARDRAQAAWQALVEYHKSAISGGLGE